eukprot:m.213159 g.213159  ORF g.213159 m.213159 type:complete len:95 (+) comp15516_c1_seq1:1383-1667(+)
MSSPTALARYSTSNVVWITEWEIGGGLRTGTMLGVRTTLVQKRATTAGPTKTQGFIKLARAPSITIVPAQGRLVSVLCHANQRIALVRRNCTTI